MAIESLVTYFDCIFKQISSINFLKKAPCFFDRRREAWYILWRSITKESQRYGLPRSLRSLAATIKGRLLSPISQIGDFHIMHMITLFTLLFITPSNPLHAEIKSAKVTIGGIVCVACISPIKKALKGKVKAIKAVPHIDIKNGIVEIKLHKNNNLSLTQLQNQLRNAVKKSTYKFEKITEVSLKGIPSKEDDTIKITISGSKKVIQLSSDFEDQVNKAIEEEKEITVTGTLTKDNDGWILKTTE